MNLDENQKRQVAGWLNEGLKLAEVQKRLEQEFGLRLTYMEVKFLVSDLDLKPRDPEPEKPAAPPASPADESKNLPAEAPLDEEPGDDFTGDADLPAPGAGGVKVSVDQLARPGAMISGKVTFANGKTSEWLLDQMGRLGVVPSADGYKPNASELREFQITLQTELQRMGF